MSKTFARHFLGQNAKKWVKVVGSGKKISIFAKEDKTTTTSMTFFTSEFECKLDAKGRLVLPARIKSQLPEGDSQELVIRKGFEQCLIIYPLVEFKKVFSKISGLNEFNEEYRKLQRNFLSGVVSVELDGNGRFLIPKNMLTYANIDKEVMLVGTGAKVEAWNPTIYEKHQIQDPGELSKLAEKYLNE